MSPDRAWGLVSNADAQLTVIRTTDGGATWESSFIGVSSLEGFDFVNATMGWATHFDLGVYRSSDGGATWSVNALPSIEGGPYVHEGPTGLAFGNATTGWVFGYYGNSLGGLKGFVMKTTTGGE